MRSSDTMKNKLFIKKIKTIKTIKKIRKKQKKTKVKAMVKVVTKNLVANVQKKVPYYSMDKSVNNSIKNHSINKPVTKSVNISIRNNAIKNNSIKTLAENTPQKIMPITVSEKTDTEVRNNIADKNTANINAKLNDKKGINEDISIPELSAQSPEPSLNKKKSFRNSFINIFDKLHFHKSNNGSLNNDGLNHDKLNNNKLNNDTLQRLNNNNLKNIFSKILTKSSKKKELINEDKDTEQKYINNNANIDNNIKKIFENLQDKKKYKIGEKLFLKDAFRKAGYEYLNSKVLKDTILYSNIIFIAVLSVMVFAYGIFSKTILSGVTIMIILWLLVLPLFLLLSWGGTYLFLDYKKYRRRVELEEVWPEYLQLVVANMNAGMLIDVALWSAVKPRFKVLAKEIGDVAKQTMTGVDLAIALTDFSEKYDSPMLKRTISILIEGMNSGGKIALLLNKIALDIQDTKIMKKEMAAGVMTYAIFISFATMVAAPFLFGLSTVLLGVTQKIMGTLSQTSSATPLSFISLKPGAIKITDFKIFAYVMLAITSFVSACIIGIIRKGSIRDGLKYIPFFVAGTLIIYYLSVTFLSTLMGGLI